MDTTQFAAGAILSPDRRRRRLPRADGRPQAVAHPLPQARNADRM